MATNQTTSRERRAQLLDRARRFCAAFASTKPPKPKRLLDEHFTSAYIPAITEHGPSWAEERLPFVGRYFGGRLECLEYFDLLNATLKFKPERDSFPGSDGGFVIDVDAIANYSINTLAYGGSDWAGRGVVSVVGRGTFESIDTGMTWEEKFIWKLSGFDDEGKIGHWEIWADPLSAWFAVGGEEFGGE